MVSRHPLQRPDVVRAIERAASAHGGRPWAAIRFTDLNDRASHPCGIHHGEPFSVFAKLATDTLGPGPGPGPGPDPGGSGGRGSGGAGTRPGGERGGPDIGDGEQFRLELLGLDLLRQRSGVSTPVPVGPGIARVDGGWLLLLEAVDEIPAAARTPEHWRDIGRCLARVHSVTSARFGLVDFDGYVGPLYQDNRPVDSNRWADFYPIRRVIPGLRTAVDSGHLPPELAAGVERLVGRLPSLMGPEPVPSLLHGDAQQNNVLTTASGTVLFDTAPYFGHPEVDLALLDIFARVPDDVFDGYREVAPIDPDFPRRRELWRLFSYLAVISVDGASDFGRPFLDRLARLLAAYG
jgi:fructosamine-3-kinase